MLEDFPRFWQLKRKPAEGRKLLLSLFARVWAKHRAIAAVTPHAVFARYFTAVSVARPKRANSRPGWRLTMTGATGLESASVTPEIEIRL